MTISCIRLSGLAGFLLCFVALRCTAANLMVRDVDTRNLQVGATVSVPITITGAEPTTFTGFQLALQYNADALQFTGVQRGALIQAADASLAAADHTPYFWGVEGHADAEQVRVAGMILAQGIHVDNNNLTLLDNARIAATDGVLVYVNFTVLQKATVPLPIATAAPFDTRLVDDLLSAISTPAVSGPASVVMGAVINEGTPNWWQIANFGNTGVDPRGDPDTDRSDNEKEYLDGTDPHVSDMAVRLKPGWNLISLPLTPDNPDPSVFFQSPARDGQPLFGGTIWTYDGRRFVAADTLEPQQGYYVYNDGNAPAVAVGLGAATTGTIVLRKGWNLVGPAADVAAPATPGVSKYYFSLEGRRLRRVSPGSTLYSGRAYWIHAKEESIDLNLVP